MSDRVQRVLVRDRSSRLQYSPMQHKMTQEKTKLKLSTFLTNVKKILFEQLKFQIILYDLPCVLSPDLTPGISKTYRWRNR